VHDPGSITVGRARALATKPLRTRSAVIWTCVLGGAAQIVFALLWRGSDPLSWRGIQGAVGVLIPILIALLAGRWAGAAVGLIGSAAFIVITSTEPDQNNLVWGGLLVVLVWTLLPFVVGAAVDILRGELDELFGELEQSRAEAQQAVVRSREAHQRERKLRHIMDAALLQSDVDALLDGIAHELAEAFDADRAVLLLLEGDELRVRASHNLSEEVIAQVHVPVGKGFAGTIAATRRPRVVDDLSTIEVVSDYLARAGGSIAGVPLVADGAVIGVMHVSSDDLGRFDQDDVRLLEFVASRAARAIRDSQRAETDRSTAAELQRSLLPAELPAIRDAQVEATYRAAVEGTTVGGDFYDVIDIGEDCWLLVVGDVSGKGPKAAALTAALRYTIRASALNGDPLPDTVRLASDALAEAVGSDDLQFATALVARLAVTDDGHVIDLVRAGHPPALVVHGNGRTERLEPPGSLLGLASAPPAGMVRVTLGPGDVLLLVTDGVTEAWLDEAEYERDVAGLAAAHGDSLAGLVDALAAAAAGRRHRADDIAILAVRPTPAAVARSVGAVGQRTQVRQR